MNNLELCEVGDEVLYIERKTSKILKVEKIKKITYQLNKNNKNTKLLWLSSSRIFNSKNGSSITFPFNYYIKRKEE
jgi:hypothetical protein